MCSDTDIAAGPLNAHTDSKGTPLGPVAQDGVGSAMDPRGHAGRRSESAIGSRYVLVTAAYNEERHIADTLQSVTNQSLPPRRWVVVSDASTDRTDEIVRSWAARNPVIRLLRVNKATKHDFASKVRALRRGFAHVEDLDYD